MEPGWMILVGALAAGLPLIGAIVTVMVDRERWINLAIKQEERQREVIRWLFEDCKSIGTFRRDGNVLHFTKK